MSKITGLEVDYIKIRNKGYLSYDESTNEMTLSHVNTLSNFVGFEIKNLSTMPDFFEVFDINNNYIMTFEFDFNLGSLSTVTKTKGDVIISSIIKSNNLLAFNYQAPSFGGDKLVFHLYSNDNSNDTYISYDTLFHDMNKPIGSLAARYINPSAYLSISPIYMNVADFTVSFWLRCSSVQSFTDQGFLSSTSTGNIGSIVVFNGNLKVWGATSASGSMDSAGLNDLNWHHAGVIKTGTRVRYYFDFVESENIIGTDPATMEINYAQVCRFYGAYGFNGDISNLQIYDYALGTGDMKRYAFRHVDNTKGENCKACFTFDNTFNSTVNGYTGTQNGGVTYVSI